MPAIKILSPGLTTSLQGRPFRGSRHSGMPGSGAGDALSMALANWLAGNGAETPAIETAFAPLSFKVSDTMTIGISGAVKQALVNGKPHSCDSGIHLRSGDILSLPAVKYACRSYIAVHGGFRAAEFLGGNSTYMPARIGGSASISMAEGAILETEQDEAEAPAKRELPAGRRLSFGDHFILRFIAGPEYDRLTGAARQLLVGHVWNVGRRGDRMGLQLDGEILELSDDTPMDSSAVFPGSLQCPRSGQPFLLGADAQTTGGYPRIAQICRADRHVIGQLRPGAKVSLQRIEIGEAKRLYRSKMQMLRELQPDIRLD